MDTKLDKARKLLAMAEGAGTAAEAEAFAAKAMGYMAAHGIERADIEGADPSRIDLETVPVRGSYVREKAALLGVIATAKRCKVVQHTTGRKITGVSLIGFTADREAVVALWRSLVVQAERQLVDVAPTSIFGGESIAAYRRTWLMGFAAKIGQRVNDIENTATSAATMSGGSTAVVLRSRSAQVEADVAQRFPSLRTTGPRVLSGTGMAAGARAGARADLGGSRIGGGRAALPR